MPWFPDWCLGQELLRSTGDDLCSRENTSQKTTWKSESCGWSSSAKVIVPYKHYCLFNRIRGIKGVQNKREEETMFLIRDKAVLLSN